jgi:hypothetical protein
LCFHEEDKLRTVIWEYAGIEVPAQLLESLNTFANGGTGNVGLWLSPGELHHAQLRASHLVTNATYPEPDEDGDWPPYPWPLI